MAQESVSPRTEVLLEVRDISKSFNIGPLRQLVIDQCSFAIEPRLLTVLIGPSGSG